MWPRWHLVAMSSKPTPPHLVTQCIAMNAQVFRCFTLIALILFENSPEKMGFKFPHGLLHTDSTDNHLSNEFF